MFIPLNVNLPHKNKSYLFRYFHKNFLHSFFFLLQHKQLSLDSNLSKPFLWSSFKQQVPKKDVDKLLQI